MCMTNAEAIQKTLEDIEEIQAVNAALPIIKKVVEQFDGKVLNKRFETALQEAGLPGRIYLSTHYENSWEVCYHPGTNRNSNNWYTVLHGTRPSCKYYEEEKSFVNPDKRINARRAFEIIEAGRVERLKTITAYREHLETWEAKKAQIEQLKQAMAAITAGIPYTMLDRFNMRVKYY